MSNIHSSSVAKPTLCIGPAARVIVLALAVLQIAPAAFAGIVDADHLVCFKAKNVDKTLAGAIDESVSVTMPLTIAPQDCQVKGKVRYVCARSEKNGGDDPRGTDPGTDYACYKIKCRDSSGIFGIATESQFGLQLFELDRKKAQIICAPIDPDF